jgi:glutathione gamma-glutamylcysteinyltransferase
VELSSAEGKQLFQRALAAGHLEGYFPLSQNAVTQTDPRIAPLSTLSVVLNALSHDPGQRWKGPWRWNSEEMMLCGSNNNREAEGAGGGGTACGHTPEMLDRDLTVADFSALARCKGVRAVRHGAGGAGGGEAFRARIREVCGDKEARMQIVIKVSREGEASSNSNNNNKSRGVFCTVAGYSEERDMVLVMDVARSSNAPVWMKLTNLWGRMEEAREGKLGGGYVILSSWTTEEPTQAELCPTAVRSWAEHKHSGRRHLGAVRSSSSQHLETTLRVELGREGREASSAVPVAA